MSKFLSFLSRKTEEKVCIVIGGGIAGTSQAYYLAQNPRNRVILIDQHKECGMGTTRGNSCMIMVNNAFPNTFKPLLDFFPKGIFFNDVVQKIDLPALFEPGVFKYTYYWLKANKPHNDCAESMRLNQFNFDLIKQMIQENRIDHNEIDYEENCSYANLYSVNTDKIQGLKQKLKANFGLDNFYERKDIEEKLLSKFPNVRGQEQYNLCLMEPLAKVDSYKFSKAIHKLLLRKKNFESYLGQDVKSFLHDGQQVKSLSIQSNQSGISKVIKGDEFYLCTGPQTPSLLAKQFQIEIPIVPVKGYSFEFKSPTKGIDTHLKWGQIGCVATYLNNDVIRFSGFGDIAGSNYQIDQKRMNYMKQIASRFYGEELIMTKSFNEWCGLRPCSPDDKPIIGKLRPFTNLILNSGHGGRGITQGFATSKLLAQLNEYEGLNKEYEDYYLKPFSSQRFNL